MIDAVIPRPQLRDSLGLLLDLMMSDFRLSSSRDRGGNPPIHTAAAAWQQLQLSRHEERPTASGFIARIAHPFIPIRGDRMGGDDPSVIAGFASIAGEAVVIIGQERPLGGASGDGWIRPGGFRKATRALKLARKFGLPVITLLDTVGAHPGSESEEDGLGYAIAQCMATFLEIPVPTIAVIIGEANSEAAAAMAAADRVLMLDNAVYEVIRPEDAARILYGAADQASEAAERLRITSHDCLKLGIIDGTVPEPGEGAHTNPDEAALLLRRALIRTLAGIQRQPEKRRLDRRYDRYRSVGSTRSWVRGTVERRVAHLVDRLEGTWLRLARRAAPYSGEYDAPDIPI